MTPPPPPPLPSITEEYCFSNYFWQGIHSTKYAICLQWNNRKKAVTYYFVFAKTQVKKEATPTIFFVKLFLSINRKKWKFLQSERTVCASLLAYHRAFRNIPDASVTFTKSLIGKMFQPSRAILHGLASIFINNSFFSRGYNSSLWFLRSIQIRSGWCAFT